MKTILLCLALLCAVLAVPKWHEISSEYTFEQYTRDFQKNYVKGSSEYEQKKRVFEAKLKDILEHNSNSAHTYKRGINHFTDMSHEEFKSSRLGYTKGFQQSKNQQFRQLLLNKDITPEEMAALPTSVDWRDHNVVSPVKDQGHCGSCWAFATVSVIESHAAIAADKHLKVLSTEQLVTCMTNTMQCGGQGGCQGAVAELGFNYVQLFGLTSEYKYPYQSYQGKANQCTWDHKSMTPEVTVDGYLKLPVNSYNHLLHAVATQGPIAISVDASKWHDYEEGVYSGCDVTQNVEIDHAVVLVGYGTDDKLGDYWLVRNSWGTRWGEHGYIRLRRESNPQCGMDNTPAIGNACIGQTDAQKVCGQCGILSDSSYPLNVQVIG